MRTCVRAHVHTHCARVTAALKGHLVGFFSQINQVPSTSIKEEEESNNSHIVIWKRE